MTNDFTTICERALALCSTFESGQAQMPLTDYFSNVMSPDKTPSFTFTLLGTSQDVRSQVLAWICGQDFKVLALKSPSQRGLLQIDLCETGYVLEVNGQRREFDRLDPFLDALQDENLVSDTDTTRGLSPVALQVAGPAGVQGISIFMPANLQVLQDEPQLYSTLLSKTNFLVLAASTGHQFTTDERRVLQDLLSSMDAILPLVMGDLQPGAAGWWKDRSLVRPQNCLMPVFLGDSLAAPLPPIFTDASHPFRSVLFENAKSTQLQHAVTMTTERFEREEKQLQTRLNKARNELTKLEGQATQAGNGRKPIDEIRSLIKDTHSKLKDETDLELKRTLQATGDAAKLFRHVEAIEAESIEQSTEGRTIRLSVSDDLLTNLNSSLSTVLNQTFTKNGEHVAGGLRKLQERLYPRLEKIQPGKGAIKLPEYPEASRKQVLEFVDQLTIRYRGELPRRTFWQRISEGRRSMYSVLMIVSIFGSLFGVNRSSPVITLAMIGLFVGGFLFSFVSMRKEDALRLAKEVDRIRDTLSSEVKRSLQSLQREVQQSFVKFLNDSEQTLVKEVEALIASTDNRSNENQNRKRTACRDKVTLQERQITDLAAMGRQIKELQRETEKFVASTQDSFKKGLQQCQLEGLPANS